MRRLLILSAIVCLAACTKGQQVQQPLANPSSLPATTPQRSTGASITLSLKKAVHEGKDGVVTSDVTLAFTGALVQDVVFKNVVGEPFLVNRRTYTLSREERTLVLFSSWFAGAGEEIRVTQRRTPPSLLIERREGGEEGTCSPFQEVQSIPLSANTYLRLSPMGALLDQSSLAFCK